MDIYYNDKTLYVNVEKLTESSIVLLKKRVFNILDDYDIANIVLKLISDSKNNDLVDDFILEYNNRYNGNIIVK